MSIIFHYKINIYASLIYGSKTLASQHMKIDNLTMSYVVMFKDTAAPESLQFFSKQSLARKTAEVNSEAIGRCWGQCYECPGVSHRETEPISNRMQLQKISSGFKKMILETRTLSSNTTAQITNSL